MTDRYATLRLGLVGAWCPSLDGIGTVVPDRGNRRNNLANAAPTGTMQRGGYGLYITGSNDAAVATNTAVQRVMNGATTATISGWVRRNATTSHVSLGFTGDSVQGNRFGFSWQTDSNIYAVCESDGSSAAYVYASVTGTAWIHVAIVYDGSLAAASRLSLWVNGVRLTTTAFGTIGATLSASLGTFALGRTGSTTLSATAGAAGWIDDARVYSRVVTPSGLKLLASQRGIGLVPTRHRRASALSQFWLRQSGTWSRATPWINVGGTWKRAAPKIRVGGVWKG